MTHEYQNSHEHAAGHTHDSGHTHDPAGHGTGGHTHGPAGAADAGTASAGAAAASGGPSAPLDRERLVVLLRNWVEHNEGHRRSYLEWRDRLAAEGLPATTAAMERLAALAEEANVALHGALDELSRE